MSVTGIPSVIPLHRSAEQASAPHLGAVPWEVSSYVEPRAKMTTTEIIADTTGDHGAHPAADGTAVAREVTKLSLIHI